MAQPVFYQTLNMEGVDPTVYYTNLATAGGSVTPEYPAPPFLPGTQAFGSDGSQFIFVQASTSISLTDFVMINAGATSAPYMANSVTTTNVQSSIGVGLGSSGLVLKQSVSFIPAGAYFWACTKGQFLPATTSATFLTSNNPPVYLYTSSVNTAGTLTATYTSTTAALAGIAVVNSLTTSTGIAASVVPPAGTLSSTGLTLGPVVALNNVRTVPAIFSSTNALVTLNIASF